MLSSPPLPYHNKTIGSRASQLTGCRKKISVMSFERQERGPVRNAPTTPQTHARRVRHVAVLRTRRRVLALTHRASLLADRASA
jgi:hypothetical protein